MNFHPKIVLIYALLSLKCRDSNLRAFLIHKHEFCPSFRPSNACIFPKKIRLSFTRLLIKMIPSKEFATLQLTYTHRVKAPVETQKLAFFYGLALQHICMIVLIFVVRSGISEHPNEPSESHFCIILRKKQLIHPCLQLCVAGSSSLQSLQYNFSGFYE